jgi:hypothetical protein
MRPCVIVEDRIIKAAAPAHGIRPKIAAARKSQ